MHVKMGKVQASPVFAFARRRTVVDLRPSPRNNADDGFSLKPEGTGPTQRLLPLRSSMGPAHACRRKRLHSGGIALLLVACLDQPNGGSSRLALLPRKPPSRPRGT